MRSVHTAAFGAVAGAAVMLVVQVLYQALRRWNSHSCGYSNVSGVSEEQKTVAGDLGALLQSGDCADTTLVVGSTQLAAHRAILVARSPVFAAMMGHNYQEASSGRIVITDIEPEVLRQLLVFLYTDQAPQLPTMAPQLLVAADKYDVAALKAQCELIISRDLSVDNAVACAVLAVRHSCQSLRKSIACFIKIHFAEVMATQGWANMVRNHSDDAMEIIRLLTAPYTRNRSSSEDNMGKKLIQAAKDGAVKELRVLLATGVNVEAQGQYRMTALHWAAERGHVDAVRCLLQAWVTVDARDRRQQTPLHWAAQSGHPDVVRLLAAASADPNCTDRQGYTPLHLAAGWGRAEAARALLEVGADGSIRDSRGRTPQEIAIQHNMQDLVAILR